MPARNTCECHAGRLVEIRVAVGFQNAAEVTAIFSVIHAQAERFSESQRMVLVTDWRSCVVMAEDAASQMVAEMRGVNARGRMERSGALLPVSSSIAMLQFVRLLRESNNPNRRGFKEPDALIAWLSEVLTPEEEARLRTFVG